MGSCTGPEAVQVATYSRVSTAHHDQNPAIQVEELRRYCASRGWSIAHEVVDHGFSGGTDNRPGFKTLMALARQRKIDAIVVVKLDRLFRSIKHLVTTLDELTALGVGFIAIKDAVDYSTPQGRLFTQILASLAEFEKALITERTLMGLAHARRQGKRLGRPRKRDDEAIHRLRAQGMSYSQIQKHLGISRGAVCRALGPKSSSKCDPKSVVKSGGGND